MPKQKLTKKNLIKFLRKFGDKFQHEYIGATIGINLAADSIEENFDGDDKDTE